MVNNHTVSPVKSFSLNCLFESVHLLNIQLIFDLLLVFKHFIVNYSFTIPPNTDQSLSYMQLWFGSECSLIVGTRPFFSLLHIQVKTLIFVAENIFSRTLSLYARVTWRRVSKLVSVEERWSLFLEANACGTHAPCFWALTME